MLNRFNPTTLVRWTAALLAISAVIFALAVLMERSGEYRELSAASERLKTGEASAPTEAGESQEENEQAEGSHTEVTKAGESGEQDEEIFGVNLENPLLVWGFVGVSLLLAVAVLRFGKPALLLTIPLAGAAALLDVREVFFQFGRANMLIANLALLIALAHAAAAILALMAWRTLRATGQAASNANTD
jgi:hypothetical protein